MRAVIIMISFLFFFASCNKPNERAQEIPNIKVDIAIERLDQTMFEVLSEKEMLVFLKENEAFSIQFLHADQYPSEEILASRIFRLLQEPSIDTLYQEVQQKYPNLDFLEMDMEIAFGKLRSINASIGTPRVITAISGLYNDLYVSDSLIIVGLDYFVGKGASYQPMDTPDYILKRYDRPYLSAIIIKFLAGQQLINGDESTLLSEMIDFGKTYYLSSRLGPTIPDSVFLGYSSEEMDIIYANESVIWANFVENEVLYETSHIIKRKFLGERPNVFEISAKCPGRIGAWVGWRIVESYMSKNEVAIEELLRNSNNTAIFRQSGYKPRSR